MSIVQSTPPVRAIVVLVCLLGTTTALAHENHAPLPTKGVTIAGNNVLLSDKARTAIGLTTETIVFGDLHRAIEVNARVELPWNQQAMITSLVPGKIDQTLVPPGQAVSAGQELARVVSMELESLQLAMLRAAGAVDLARRLVQQQRSLDAEGVVPGKSLLEAEATLAQETAELRVAQEKMCALGISDETLESILAGGQPLRWVSITSPITGVITHADVRVGQVVETTDHLYHVVDPSRVWIVGEVLESDVRHLKPGQPMEATFAALPGKRIDGVIDHVRLKMDRRRRTQSVVIAIDNADGLLRPGMFGRMSITVRIAKEAVVCPADAIIKSRSGRYVLVQRKPGKYESRPVKLGLAKGSRVEVLEGVFPGDKVVVMGSYLLASLLGNEHKARVSGDKVEIAPASEPDRRLVAIADAIVELPTDRQAFAGTRIEGRVTRVHVQPSQRVEEGDVLAEVDCLELRTVQLNLLQACSQLRLVQQSLTRLEQLAQRGITPQQRVWEAQSQQETLTHQVESLCRQLAFLGLTEPEIAKLRRIDLAQLHTEGHLFATVPIRAPAAGWIVEFHVVPGQVVHPEDQLFEIHDLSQVWVKGYLFERDAGRVAVGQPARVTFSAFPELEAIGKVVRIAPMMDESERVLPVWIEVDNPNQLLKEGMLARVSVLAQPDEVDDGSDETAQLRAVEPRR